jgi:hypothetical protein
MSYDQFDYEQQIMSCWNITSDLKDLSEEILEGNLSKDQIGNVLIGLEQLYNIRFEKLFRIFEQFNRERYSLLDTVKNQKFVQAQKDLFDDFELGLNGTSEDDM